MERYYFGMIVGTPIGMGLICLAITLGNLWGGAYLDIPTLTIGVSTLVIAGIVHIFKDKILGESEISDVE